MLRIVPVLALFVACAAETAEECQCSLGEVCGEGGVCVVPDGKFDLPNGALWEGPHDGQGYAAIADAIGGEGNVLDADLAQLLEPAWPLAVSETAALNRFGTPIQLSGRGYFHTALDIMRPSLAVSHDVHAPLAGKAYVFDWSGHRGYNGEPYSTVVAIWDPLSRVVVQMMHVQPSAELIAAGSMPLDVAKGQVVGTLAPVPFTDTALGDAFKHTHVTLIDGGKKLALDPSRYLPYRDTLAPVVGDVYVLDSSAQKHARLQTGKLDVIVELSDRDDFSVRNFEVAAIAFSLSLDGTVVASSERCDLTHLIDKVGGSYATHALRLLDFGNARSQVGIGAWPSSDIDNKARTFRYALTQLALADGRCTVKLDADGFIEVPDTAQTLTIAITAWDRNDNAVTAERVIAR